MSDKTVLQEAAEFGNVKVVISELARIAKKSAPEGTFKGALEVAVRFGHTEVVRLLIEARVVVHANNDEALKTACLYGHEEIARLLIEARSWVDWNYDIALKMAAAHRRTKIVEMLVEAGADLATYGNIAVLLATEYGHEETVETLNQLIKQGYNCR